MPTADALAACSRVPHAHGPLVACSQRALLRLRLPLPPALKDSNILAGLGSLMRVIPKSFEGTINGIDSEEVRALRRSPCRRFSARVGPSAAAVHLAAKEL
jgi:hypothetical protein